MMKVVKVNLRKAYDQKLERLISEIAKLNAEVGRGPAVTVEGTLQSLLANRQFKRSAPLPPVETERSVFVKVTSNEDCNEQFVLFVIPEELEVEAEKYKERLQKLYGAANKSEIPFPDLVEFREHLVMAKMDGIWRRCRILNYIEGIVSVEDIDSGTKDIQMPPDVFKLPRIGEMTKPAFASKVIVDNMSSDEEIPPNNYIRIRMTHVDPFGMNFAEAELEEVSSLEQSQDLDETRDVEPAAQDPPAELIEPAFVAPPAASETAPPAVFPPADLSKIKDFVPEPSRAATPPAAFADETFAQHDETRDFNETWQTVESLNATTGTIKAPARHYYVRNPKKRHVSEINYMKKFTLKSHIQMMDLRYGLNVNLVYISGADLNNGFLDVSGTAIDAWADENNTTFVEMENDIADYLASMPNEPYKPAIGELCLAKLKDERFHRAVCTNLKLSGATVRFIDHGFTDTVSFNDVVEFSLRFVFPCFVHTVEFSLASCRPVCCINADKTREKLRQNRNIIAQVMNKPQQPGSYKIVLDDKFVVF